MCIHYFHNYSLNSMTATFKLAPPWSTSVLGQIYKQNIFFFIFHSSECQKMYLYIFVWCYFQIHQCKADLKPKHGNMYKHFIFDFRLRPWPLTYRPRPCTQHIAFSRRSFVPFKNIYIYTNWSWRPEVAKYPTVWLIGFKFQ